jgi:hypothetical protein
MQVGLTEEEYIEVPHTENKQYALEEIEVFYEQVKVPKVSSMQPTQYGGMSMGAMNPYASQSAGMQDRPGTDIC